ncbi:NERD domain-containing protein [Bacillus sp. ISL-47]|uniref:nuclease-related domain-containing protein n=1 Tax=Bacillus sp. ISL-47 TaxID=2819130 RepID=UPI001BE6906A|nr:nuclease-related domain-containing protein [Bacillus sp. ISL-47]MBT2691265.1 NERD domain-containing protein [Bacillus sp. ISL-47]MBT2710959.1 NERD domain-containing protein [Pseudomonas sp. ISL-84]
MIIKERKIPLFVLKLEALLRRLPPGHSKIPLIKEELSKRNAGFKGESSIDFPLDFIGGKNYYIFHDIRLPVQSRFFQIDTLVLNTKFALILEVKNISGVLQFDTVYNQLIRIKSGEEQVFPCPLIQVKRQANQLKNWLSENKLPFDFPVFSLVVISNPRTGIKVIPPHINLSQKVVHRDTLPVKINQFEKDTTNEIPDKLLKKIIRLVLKQNIEGDLSILTRFHIHESELLKGVLCPKCGHLPITKVKRTWQCASCNNKNKNAHIAALTDYRLFMGPTITNQQLREFLNIESSLSATRLLKSLNLPHTGANKNRTYTLVFPNENTSQKGRH